MDDNGYAGATLRRRRLLPCVPINSSAGCESALDAWRGRKPQSWAGPAVSPGRQRRVSSFLGSREAGFGLRSRFDVGPAPSGARSRPGADLSAETKISSHGGSAPGVSGGLCGPTDFPSGRCLFGEAAGLGRDRSFLTPFRCLMCRRHELFNPAGPQSTSRASDL
jgi:hypothetical protein